MEDYKSFDGSDVGRREAQVSGCGVCTKGVTSLMKKIWEAIVIYGFGLYAAFVISLCQRMGLLEEYDGFY